jgi:hypothetical protein
MDDWMVIDAGSIIVNVMAADVRAALDLEAFYEKMELGKDPYAGMTYDAWLDANPIPDAWLQRLERDERVRFLHLGNLAWNAVNLGLALVSLITEWNQNPAAFDAKESLMASERLEKVFSSTRGSTWRTARRRRSSGSAATRRATRSWWVSARRC